MPRLLLVTAGRTEANRIEANKTLKKNRTEKSTGCSASRKVNGIVRVRMREIRDI